MKENLSLCYAIAALLCLASTSIDTAEARGGDNQGGQQENQNQADNTQQRQKIGANVQGQRNQQAAQQQANNAQQQERQRANQQDQQNQRNQQAAQQQARNAQQEERQRANQQDQQNQRNQQAAQQQAKNAQQEERQRANQQEQRDQQAAQQKAKSAQQEKRQRANQQDQRDQQAAQQQAKNAQQQERQRANQQDQREHQAAQEQSKNAQQQERQRANQQDQRDQKAAQDQAKHNQQQELLSNDKQEQRIERLNSAIRTPAFDKATRRPSSRTPLNVSNVPLQKAFRMPDFMRNANAEQRERAQNTERNMREHLIAVQMSHAPRNYARIRNSQLNSYYNNYPFFANNQQYYINRQNTHYYPVAQNYYPNWYQPNNNWVFSNGFTLGNVINIGLEWLGFGWQPYYGETPVGFICARDYMPTPWMYESMSNQWRQPGLYTYMSEGPNSDYTGPITVEVIEQVSGPGGSLINVPYLYNAFYYPESGRWGYENQQGYFIWLDA